MTVESTQLSASGEINGDGCKALSLWVKPGATDGSVILKDGGSSGTAKLTIEFTASDPGFHIEIPGGGMLFGTDCYATLTNVDSTTVIYETES